uniref:Vacuolar protein 8 n=1 Tax=Guillardia theta TaxID=55529 RepID=A0A7S4K8L0_GUITH|mmetsp:Transcript_21758/g.71968  ORF Transcript_21758/g.71968 Transcript_21758/m.71968 type:complete len:664 (+) Transcript_21758:33-2024(+)
MSGFKEEPRSGKPAGVGIYFQESGSKIVVNHLIRGGSAERSGKIIPGDVITAIDGKNVEGKSVGELRNYIVGIEGSSVNLSFLRESDGSSNSFDVMLVRGSPEFIATLYKAEGPSSSSEIRPESPRTSLSQVISSSMTPQEPMRSPAVMMSPASDNDALMRVKRELEESRITSDKRLKEKFEAEREKQTLQRQLDEVLQTLKETRREKGRIEHELAEEKRRLEEASQQHESKRQALQRELDYLREERDKSSSNVQSEASFLRQELENLTQKLRNAEVARDIAEDRCQVLIQQKAELASRKVENPDEALKAEVAMKDTEIARLKFELENLKEGYKTTTSRLQEAIEATQNTPVHLDNEFRDTGRLAILAIPHLVSHLHSIQDGQESGKGGSPSTSILIHALNPVRARCLSCIPQSIPQLVSLLVSRQVSTVRESSFAIALSSVSQEGRGAILSMPQALGHLNTLLNSSDIQTRRNGAVALGNIAMEGQGRTALLQVFDIIPELLRLLIGEDMECKRSAALALGNLFIESLARDQYLNIHMSVKELAEQLKSPDRFLVRYTTGAIRNIAVDEKGRRAVLAQQEAVAALKGLLASPDQITSKFATSALKNLSMTPLASGLTRSEEKSNVQVPERVTASFLGLPIPFADSDGLGIPQTITKRTSLQV